MSYKNDLERKDYNIRVRVDKLTYLKLNAMAKVLKKTTSELIRILLSTPLQNVRLEDLTIKEEEKQNE